MKKYLKVLVILLGLIFICGFDKSDYDYIMNNYSSIFENEGALCNYSVYPPSSNTNDLGFSKYNLYVTKNGLYDQYDNNSANPLITSDYQNKDGYININGKRYKYTNFNVRTFLKYIKDNAKCPTYLYFCQATGDENEQKNTYEIRQQETDNTFNHTCYAFVSSDAKVEEVKPNGCNYANAKLCKQYTKKIYDRTVYIELGLTNNNDNYVVFSYNSKFSPRGINIGNGSSITASLNGEAVTVSKDDKGKNFFDYYCSNGSCNFPDDIDLPYACADYIYQYFVFKKDGDYDTISKGVIENSCYKANNYDEAVENARKVGNTCVYASADKKYVYGYTVSVGLSSNTANYQFYLFDGSPSSKTYSDTGVEAVYSKNSCNPYVIACLNDDPMHFYYKENSSSFAIKYNDTSCTNGQTTLSLVDSYMSQEEGINKADEDYKCVYRDENNTIAATNLNSVLGLTDVYLLRYNGIKYNDKVEVTPPADGKCPTYFLYARQSDEGSFGGTGNNTFYSQFGNDFNELCKLAKTKNNIAYEVLTLSSEELPSTACSSTTPINGNEEEVGNANNVLLNGVEGMDICSQNGVKNVLHVIGYLLFAVKIAVPLLLVIMGSIDCAQALMASDDKAIKDATAKLVKRVIAGIIVFFIPTILNFGLGLIDGVSNNQTNFTGCSSCLFTPFDGSCTYTKIGE